MISLLDFPTEIRLDIYTYSLNPNEYVKSYRKLREASAKMHSLGGPICALPRIYVKRYTPSILLLNKQISAEALSVLYNIPLHLYGTPASYFTMRQMDIAEFISEHFLQRIRHGALHLDHAHKHFVLLILDIWGADNRLEKLDVYIPKQIESLGRHWDVVQNRVFRLCICNLIY